MMVNVVIYVEMYTCVVCKCVTAEKSAACVYSDDLRVEPPEMNTPDVSNESWSTTLTEFLMEYGPGKNWF